MRTKGEGHFKQYKEGKWRVWSPPLPPDNKRLTHVSKATGSAGLKECQQWLRNTMLKYQHGYIKAPIKTTEDLVNHWLSIKKITVDPNTYRQYELTIRLHIIPQIGKDNFRKTTHDMIQKYYDFLLNNGVGAYTIRRVHIILKSAFRYAYRSEWISVNPIDLAVPPSHEKKEQVIWTLEETRKFLEYIQGEPLEHLIYVAIATGMRQGELLGLKYSDIDMASGVIRVNRQVKRPKGGGFVFKDPKTKNAKRPIVIGETTMHHITEQKKLNERMKLLAGPKWEENQLVFPQNNGKPRWQPNLYMMFQTLCEEAGVPKIPFHNLRHIDTTLILDHGGFSLVGVSKRLGHSNPSITLDHYGHGISIEQQRMAEYIDDILRPNGKSAHDLHTEDRFPTSETDLPPHVGE